MPEVSSKDAIRVVSLAPSIGRATFTAINTANEILSMCQKLGIYKVEIILKVSEEFEQAKVRIDALEAENSKLREGLRFYADKNNYSPSESFNELSSLNNDLEYFPSNRGSDLIGGKRARQCLKECGG